MPIQRMTFEQGEEKLAQAFEQITNLWLMVFALNARAEIDSAAMRVLLQSRGSADLARQLWRQESGALLAAQAEKRDQPEFGLAGQMVTTRAAFWDAQIENLAWPDAGSRH